MNKKAAIAVALVVALTGTVAVAADQKPSPTPTPQERCEKKCKTQLDACMRIDKNQNPKGFTGAECIKLNEKCLKDCK